MISIVESFFCDLTGFGERTQKSVYTLTDEEANRKDTEINKDNLIVRDENITVV